MRTKKELTDCFFSDLHSYNNRNFKTIATADLSVQDATTHKAFSSAITRYFIFREKHPEISEEEFKILYFVLSLDLVATYFAEYPDTTLDNLVAFQLHVKNYVKEQKRKRGEDYNDDIIKQESALSDIGLESDNEVQIEQQQRPVSVAS